jgi:hypothetical protein
LVLGELRSTRENTAQTEAKLDRVISLSDPVAEEAIPLLDRTTTLVSETVPVARDASAFFSYLADNGIDASVFLDQLPALSRGAGSFLEDAVVAAQLATDFLARAEAEDLVAKASDSHRLLQEILAVQLATLKTQRMSYRTQRSTLQVQINAVRKLRRSLDLQRGTLAHVRSLDNKTGGEVPPP